MGFTCSKCGFCCQSVGILVEKVKQISQNDAIFKEIASFPYEYDKAGRCSKLSLDNLCSVYESRPDMCNVTVFHKKYFSEIEESEFFKMNENACNLLKQQYGMDIS